MCNNPTLLLFSDCVGFPPELKRYGLNEMILQEAFVQSVSGVDVHWALTKGSPCHRILQRTAQLSEKKAIVNWKDKDNRKFSHCY